jgi:Putative polyhydroxyalkanoic acid system protein (PHA_gran_rgn)
MRRSPPHRDSEGRTVGQRLLDYQWEGDTLNFVGSGMWQRIIGWIEVLDDVVRVKIDLPWIMQLLRDTVAKQLGGRGVAMLEKPKSEG